MTQKHERTTPSNTTSELNQIEQIFEVQHDKEKGDTLNEVSTQVQVQTHADKEKLKYVLLGFLYSVVNKHIYQKKCFERYKM